jgi:hypothetical protein
VNKIWLLITVHVPAVNSLFSWLELAPLIGRCLTHFNGRGPSWVINGGEGLPPFSSGSWLVGVDICYAETKLSDIRNLSIWTEEDEAVRISDKII